MLSENTKLGKATRIVSLDRDKEKLLQNLREQQITHPTLWDYTVKLFKK